ncbi:MAG: biotin/lipoyl-containing protein, partial [Candidatus Nanopelagicaceae bacterium]
MTFSVTMPALGESVTEGTVTRWLKNEGDVVAVDEPLLEVSTDKVDTEIPSPAAGVLQKIVVGPDQTVAVGTELAIIASEGSAPAPVATPVSTPAPVTPPPAPVSEPVANVNVAQVPPVSATPSATSNGTVVTMP